MTDVLPPLLQLVALGTNTAGPHLAAGQHLRWFPSPDLGFPQGGFQVLRRPSLVWRWEKNPASRTAPVKDTFAGGSTLTHDDGVSIAGVVGAPQSRSRGRVDLSTPVTIRFQRGGLPAPAAMVALQLHAAGQGGADPTVLVRGFQDQGGGPVDTAIEHVRLSSLRHWSGPESGQVLVLGGPVLDGVVVVGQGVELAAVSWIDAGIYADDPLWTAVADLGLPIRAAGDHQGVSDPDAVAAQRLARWTPTHSSPLDEPTWPARALPATEARARSEGRYLGPQLERMQRVLEQVLQAAAEQGVPHTQVPLPGSDELHSDLDDATAQLDLPAILLLLAQAMDPAVAALLGLAWHDDEDPPGEAFDYQVRAHYSAAVLQTLGVTPSRRRLPAVGALFTHVRRRPPVDVPPPRPTAELQPAPGLRPVPARVRLEWPAAPPGPVSVPGRVSALVRRDGTGGEVYVGRTDAESGLTVLPLLGSGAGGRTDDQLTAPGPVGYRVWAMDLWGRFSDPAEVAIDVADRVAPPPPAGLTAEHHGLPDAEDRFERMTVGFTWSTAHAAQAPDVARFEVHVGAHRAVDTAGGAAVPAGCVAAVDLVAADPAVGVGWPTGAGADVAVEPDGAEGHRVSVTVRDVPALVETGGRRVTSVTVVAVDGAGNRSVPARPAVTEWYDPTPPQAPPGLPGVPRTTWPDAQGRCWWRVEWAAPPPGSRTRVLRADESRLLAADGRSRADVAALSEPERAQLLRGLAARHRGAFVPAAPEPLDDTARGLDLWISADDRGLHVLVALPISASGIVASWPGAEAFTVVAARRLTPLGRPRVLVDRSGAAVELVVQAPGAATVRVYRSVDPARVDDLADMRPLLPVPVVEGVATVADSAPQGGWVAYRALAVAPSGALSDATPAVWLHG